MERTKEVVSGATLGNDVEATLAITTDVQRPAGDPDLAIETFVGVDHVADEVATGEEALPSIATLLSDLV